MGEADLVPGPGGGAALPPAEGQGSTGLVSAWRVVVVLLVCVLCCCAGEGVEHHV